MAQPPFSSPRTLGRGDLDVVERDLDLMVGGDGLQRLIGDAGALGVDQEEGDAVLALAVLGAGDDQELVGCAAVGDEELGAIQGVLVAVLRRGELDARGLPGGRGLGLGVDPDFVAGGNLAEMRLLLGVGAKLEDRHAAEDDGVEEGRGGEVAAHLLDKHGEVEEAEAVAAVLLGEDHAHPTLAGHFLPEFGRIAEVVFLHGAHDLFRRFLGEKLPRRGLDHLLLFAKTEVHSSPP